MEWLKQSLRCSHKDNVLKISSQLDISTRKMPREEKPQYNCNESNPFSYLFPVDLSKGAILRYKSDSTDQAKTH